MADSTAQAMTSDTFLTIETRLRDLTPPILLKDHIGKAFIVYGTTLQGVDFLIKDRQKLLKAFRDARDTTGNPVFAEGSKEDAKHWERKGIKGDPNQWALKLSFAKTNGIGFREIWRLKLTDRALRLSRVRPPGLRAPELDGRFSGNFGDDTNLPDFSSLHCGVADDVCNIHIDDMGFVITGPNGEVIVDPDFFRHLVVELLWKTNLRGRIPDWAVDRVNFIIPSSPNNYSKLGVSFDVAKSKQYRLTVSGSCGLAAVSGFECSGTINLTGSHDLLGGSR
jgi:hypothetical protein